MSPDLNTIQVSVALFTDLLEKATRYDVIRKSIVGNIRKGKTYNVVDSELVRMLTDTANANDFLEPDPEIIGTPEEDDGK